MLRVRTQVYPEGDQHQWLLNEAHEMGISMPGLVRQILADYAWERRLSPPRDVLEGITNLGDSALMMEQRNTISIWRTS